MGRPSQILKFLFTVCESEFPLCQENFILASMTWHMKLTKLSLERISNQSGYIIKVLIVFGFTVWPHQLRLPKPVETVVLLGVLIWSLRELESCTRKKSVKNFCEGFLLLLTASGYANFALMRGQVVVLELPERLREEERQILVCH
jgi:hypothetical protein